MIDPCCIEVVQPDHGNARATWIYSLLSAFLLFFLLLLKCGGDLISFPINRWSTISTFGYKKCPRFNLCVCVGWKRPCFPITLSAFFTSITTATTTPHKHFLKAILCLSKFKNLFLRFLKPWLYKKKLFSNWLPVLKYVNLFFFSFLSKFLCWDLFLPWAWF